MLWSLGGALYQLCWVCLLPVPAVCCVRLFCVITLTWCYGYIYPSLLHSVFVGSLFVALFIGLGVCCVWSPCLLTKWILLFLLLCVDKYIFGFEPDSELNLQKIKTKNKKKNRCGDTCDLTNPEPSHVHINTHTLWVCSCLHACLLYTLSLWICSVIKAQSAEPKR